MPVSQESKSLVGKIEFGIGLVSSHRKHVATKSAAAASIGAGSRFSKYYLEKMAILDQSNENSGCRNKK